MLRGRVVAGYPVSGLRSRSLHSEFSPTNHEIGSGPAGMVKELVRRR